MSIYITLTPEEEQKLAELARARGQDPVDHVHDVVISYLNGVDPRIAKSFAKILAPIWDEWRKSGMSAGEIDDLFEQELQVVRRERRQPKNTP
jgi:hypothetical protein